MSEAIQKARRFLSGRKTAYTQVFHKDNVFTSQVLADLAKFCRAHDSTFSPDQRAHAMLEGRREVWLRIQRHLNLSDEELYQIHNLRRGPE